MTKRSTNTKALTALALATVPSGVFAAVAEGMCRSTAGGYCVNLAAANFPGLEFLGEAVGLGDLIARLYVWGLGFVGISALLVFIYGGVKYMVAGDKDPTEAKKAMLNAVIGLVVALLSWLILFTINPDLVKSLGFEPQSIKAPVGEGDITPSPSSRFRCRYGPPFNICYGFEYTNSNCDSACYIESGTCVNITAC